jgi:hypothetical protein
MRCIAIILVALSVTSCVKQSAKMVLAQCRLAADKAYATAPDRAARVSQYLMDCMATHAFEWRIDDAHCLEILGHDWATSHDECYRRTTKSK